MYSRTFHKHGVAKIEAKSVHGSAASTVKSSSPVNKRSDPHYYLYRRALSFKPQQLARTLGHCNNNSSSTTTRSTRTWILRILLLITLFSLIWFQIPTVVYLSEATTSLYANNNSPTLTLTASISAEITSHARRSGESRAPTGARLVDDCKRQNLLLDDYNKQEGTNGNSVDYKDVFRQFKDSSCGALWNGSSPGGMTLPTTTPTRILVVVSFCEKPLDWLLADLEELGQTDPSNVSIELRVFSKCNQELKVHDYFQSAPFNVRVYPLPKNNGSHHHTYAYWMAHHAQQDTADSDYIFFLNDVEKDTRSTMPNNNNSLVEMLRVVSNNGFACGLDPVAPKKGDSRIVSAYHCTSELLSFQMKWCPSGKSMRKKCDRRHFASEKYATLGAFVDDLAQQVGKDVSSSSSSNTALNHFPATMADKYPLMQVCYGDAFAVHRSQILKNDVKVYKFLVEMLGGTMALTEEDLFVERTWAGLLSDPLGPSAVSAISEMGTTCSSDPYYRGALERPHVKRTSDQTTDGEAPKMVMVRGAMYPEAVAAVIGGRASPVVRKGQEQQEQQQSPPSAVTDAPKMVMVRGAMYPEAVAAVFGKRPSRAKRKLQHS